MNTMKRMPYIPMPKNKIHLNKNYTHNFNLISITSHHYNRWQDQNRENEKHSRVV